MLQQAKFHLLQFPTAGQLAELYCSSTIGCFPWKDERISWRALSKLASSFMAWMSSCERSALLA